jgi:GT2 family glycosyltransferase
MNDLSIIIVSWNCRDFLEQCLQSLRDSGFCAPYEVIVVDNSSSDGTAALVGQRFPEVRLFVNADNVGFAAANNQGMRRSSGRYILLLNPDTTVLPGVLDGLLQFMDSHPESTVAGPVLLKSDRTPQNAGVRFPTNGNILAEALFLDRLFPRSRLFGRHKELYEDPSKPREIDVVHGAAMMVRREALGMAGGLDEDFFVYFEETDWCWRIKEAGGRVHYSAIGSIIHHGGSETGHYDERRLVYYHRSLLHFYRKHYAWWRLLLLRPILLLRSLIRIGVWGLYAMFKPPERATAMSCIRGYIKVIGIVLT